MSFARVDSVNTVRLACGVSVTLVGDDTTRTISVDADVVDFDEEAGGQFRHQPTGDIYDYDTVDHDLETLTLSAGLPSGKTFTAGDALQVVGLDDEVATDFYADVRVDDVAEDTVRARIPQSLRTVVEEGTRTRGKGPSVRAEPGAEEWEVTELTGEEPRIDQAGFFAGDFKQTGRAVAGGGVLVDGGWLKCDGSTVSRAQFPALFNAIGTTFGGSGTNFKVPNLIGRAPFGAGSAVALGETDSQTDPSLRGPGHTHNMDHQHQNVAWSGTSTATGSNTGGGLNRIQTISGTVDGTHSHGAFTGNTGGGLSTNNVLGYIGINWLIKT